MRNICLDPFFFFLGLHFTNANILFTFGLSFFFFLLFRTFPSFDVMKSCRIVYQNIDLFSLYTSMLTLLLVHFLSVLPFCLKGFLLIFIWTLTSSEAVVDSKRDKRETGQYASGEYCAALAVLIFTLGDILVRLVPFKIRQELKQPVLDYTHLCGRL